MWQSFNLYDNNPDPGGSWLYAIRYEEEDLVAHQSNVIEVMQGLGFTMFQLENGTLGISADHDLTQDEFERFMILTEELTVTNEAIESSHIRLYGKGIVGLVNTYKTGFTMALVNGDKKAAATMLRNEMPQLVSDLSRAQLDNSPLTETDYQEVLSLADFTAKKMDAVMNGDGIMVVSNFTDPQLLTVEDLPNN